MKLEFNFNWRYALDDHGDNRIFNQKIKLNLDSLKGEVVMPSFCMGTYIANLFNACKFDSEINGDLASLALEEWHAIVGDKYFKLNDKSNNRINMLFDSIAYPSFCIFKNVRTMLEEISTDTKNKYKYYSRCTQLILREGYRDLILNSDDAVKEVQKRIDEYMAQYNDLLMSLRGEFNKDFYERLCACLRTYNESELIAQYLAAPGEKGRCFATFIEDETNKKYISFSGYVDAVDEKILSWLNRSKKETEDFVKVATAICFSMDEAEFVPANLDTKRYNCVKYLPFTVKQGLSLNDVIEGNLKGMKKHYSCCERKIFGRFKDKTPNGRLYVKMKICGECCLGLYYQHSNGSLIKLFDGLEC